MSVYIPRNYRLPPEQYGPLWGQIKRICLEHLVKAEADTANMLDDLTNNTDLIIKATEIRVSCRIRNVKYFYDPSTRIQFTLRYFRKNNIPSEYSKIVKGKGNYMLYGFAEDQKILGWFILDLQKLRQFLPTTTPLKVVVNSDGSSIFHVYSLLQFPRCVITAMHDSIKEALIQFDKGWRHEARLDRATTTT